MKIEFMYTSIPPVCLHGVDRVNFIVKYVVFLGGGGAFIVIFYFSLSLSVSCYCGEILTLIFCHWVFTLS
jgi:hypothetical protein